MNLQDFKNQYCATTPNMPFLPPKIQGWGSESIALRQAIEETNPESIIEVGSWLGASAIFMASLSQAPILCIDTFLGSNEILWRRKQTEKIIYSFNDLYDQFCANITHKNLNDQISPLPMTASSAAELLSTLNVTADLIYIDAGHRYREVYADLEDYWPLTTKVLVGDDYNSEWPGVVQAANDFANKHHLNIKLLDSKFLLFR